MKKIISLILSTAIFITVICNFGIDSMAQIVDQVINDSVNIKNSIISTHDDCHHNYEITKVTGTQTCTKKAIVTYVCSICSNKSTKYEALGHLYKITDKSTKVISYKCDYCDSVDKKGAEELIESFSDYLSKPTTRGNEGYYADIEIDGYVNAMDYLYLKKLAMHRVNNPNATEQTNWIYNYIYNINKTKTLSAQQESTWMGSVDYEIDYIYNATSKYPAMRGLDYMNDDFKGVNKRAIEYAKKGGLITICWHTGSDFTGEWNDAMNDTVSDWSAMLTPNTKEYNAMIAGMDKAAKALLELQNAGVTVLWRPFHEFDGGWFWWGKNGAEPFKQMWEIMYKRYTEYWGLNNLIWVLGFSHNGTDLASWKPDEQYYDIIGADSYDKTELSKLYRAVTAINTSGKPICLHECGTNPTVDELKAQPWCYFMTWHTEYITKENDKQALKELYNSDKVLTLDEITGLGIA